MNSQIIKCDNYFIQEVLQKEWGLENLGWGLKFSLDRLSRKKPLSEIDIYSETWKIRGNQPWERHTFSGKVNSKWKALKEKKCIVFLHRKETQATAEWMPKTVVNRVWEGEQKEGCARLSYLYQNFSHKSNTLGIEGRVWSMLRWGRKLGFK